MRHRREWGRERAQTAEVDLTPMLDVVFILLIFFIVTAVFLQEKAIGLEPPPPSSQENAQSPAIIVTINEEGRVRVNGRASLIESVRANIERIRADSPESAVIIQAHPEALNGHIIRVRDQLASARVARVNMTVEWKSK